MVHKKKRTYSRYTIEAASLLGKHIRLARKERGFTESDLADRIGVSRATLQKIEKGELSCEIGFFFEAAAIVGVPLFSISYDNATSFLSAVEHVNDKIALLPKSIRKSEKQEIDDDF